MARMLRWVLLGGAGLLLLFGLLLAWVAWQFDPNQYKQQVIDLVQQKKQRTLHIPGTIRLTLLPKIGADLGQISLSARNSDEPFASIEHAKVALALWPLLQKRLVVDRISIDGLRAELVRDAAGKLNIDDLLSKEKDSGEKIALDIEGIELSNGALGVTDLASGQRMVATKLNLATGKIANGANSALDLDLWLQVLPIGVAGTQAGAQAGKARIDSHVLLKTALNLDWEQQNFVLRDLNLKLQGQVWDFSALDLKLAGEAEFKAGVLRLQSLSLAGQARHGQQQLDLKFSVPQLLLDDKQASADKIKGQFKLTQGRRVLQAELSLPGLSGAKKRLELPGMQLQMGWQDQTADLRGTLAGDWQIEPDHAQLASKQLRLTLEGKQDGVEVAGKLSSQLHINWAKQQLELDQFNSDFLLPNPRGGSMKWVAGGNARWDGVQQQGKLNGAGQLDQTQYQLRLAVQGLLDPALELNLTLDQLDLNRYLAKPGAGQEKKPLASAAGAADGTATEADPVLDLSALKVVRSTGSLAFGQVKWRELQAGNLKLAWAQNHDKLDLSSISANLYGGKLDGSASVTLAGNQEYRVKQNLAGVALGPLLKDALGKAPVDGKGSVTLDLTSRGQRASQLKQALAGKVTLLVQEGAVKGVNLAHIIKQARAKLGGEAGSGVANQDDKTEFSELSGSFNITGGVAHNDDLAAKSPLFRLSGNGDIDLVKNRLDYLVKPTVVATLQGQGGPELQALKGLTVPVRLSGPFDNIGWKIDVKGLLGDTVKQKVETQVQDKLKDALKGLLGK
jgi:AsmA protein